MHDSCDRHRHFDTQQILHQHPPLHHQDRSPRLDACFLGLLVLSLSACVAGEIDGVTFSDVEGDLVTLEGDALAAELSLSPARESSVSFVRIGLVWDADRADAIEFSLSVDGEQWTPWSLAEVHHIELERKTSFVGQLVESEARAPFRFYKLRSGVGVASYLRLELLSSGENVLEDGEGSEPQAVALGGDLEIGSRSSWGARSSRCSTKLGDAYRMAIHHTETPTNDSLSPQARLRQIQSYHMDVRGWCQP